jgi:hypothetical protein
VETLTSHHYLGYQCVLGCRYRVFNNRYGMREHMQRVHGLDPIDLAPRDRDPLRRVVWIGLAAIAGSLLMIAVVLALAFR